MNVVWQPQPRQAAFMERPEWEALYGGAAGGGKSDALVIEALRQVHIPHYKALILRKTFPQLAELIDKSLNYYPMAFPGARYNSSSHTWTFPSGAKIIFGSMQYTKDRLKYQGQAYDFVAFDELTHFSWEEYSYLFSRCRPNGPGTRCYIRSTANPGGVGHGWVKERFITAGKPMSPIWEDIRWRDPTGKEYREKRSRIFVPSSVFDNPALLRNDPDYITRLASMPEAERKALLYGDWDTFSGQVFTEWRNDPEHYLDRVGTHVISPFKVPDAWSIWCALDWGYSKPFSVGWYAVDHERRLYRIREYYGCTGTPNVGAKLEPSEVARQIKRIEAEDPNLRGKTIHRVGDPAIWGSDGTESIGALFERERVFFEKGDHARIDGKMQVHHRMAFDENGWPMLYVFSTCKHFIRTVPNLVYDEKDVEDIDTDGEDHIYDELRYPTAAAVLGWKPLLRAMADNGRVNLDLVAKYTPLQWYRSKGFSTKELGDINASNSSRFKVFDWMRGKDLPTFLNWVQGMDLLTTRKLWKASEYYIRDNRKDLGVGTDAYYKAVAEVYNRVIEETQPNYTTMQRPQLLRSEDSLLANLAMFKTQPFQNFNILYDAAKNWAAKSKRAQAGGAEQQAEEKTARRDFGRAVTSQLAQLAVFAAMTAAWALFRGKTSKYEDEDTGEITTASFLSAFSKDMAGGLLSTVPFGSDTWEYLSSKMFGDTYYGMDVTTVSAITDTAQSLDGLTDLVGGIFQSATSGQEVNWNSVRLKLDGYLDDLSKAAGVPYENVANLFNAAYRQACIATMGKFMGEYAALKMTTDPEKYRADYYDLLYKALQGDRKAYEAIYGDMVGTGTFEEEKVRSAMEKRMKDDQGVASAEELTQRYLSPEQEKVYDGVMKKVTGSSVWRSATPEQREKAEDILYDIAVGNKAGEKLRETIDDGSAYGIDDADYLLFRLALSVVDQPTQSGKMGSYTNEEVEEAIGMLAGLSDDAKSFFWTSQGKSEKSNPWG